MSAQWWVEVFVDVCFFVDIVANFRTGAHAYFERLVAAHLKTRACACLDPSNCLDQKPLGDARVGSWPSSCPATHTLPHPPTSDVRLFCSKLSLVATRLSFRGFPKALSLLFPLYPLALRCSHASLSLSLRTLAFIPPSPLVRLSSCVRISQ
eukprot:4493081-Pleurochrysis_carterae.AAC.4